MRSALNQNLVISGQHNGIVLLIHLQISIILLAYSWFVQKRPCRLIPSRTPPAMCASVKSSRDVCGCSINQLSNAGCELPTQMAKFRPVQDESTVLVTARILRTQVASWLMDSRLPNFLTSSNEYTLQASGRKSNIFGIEPFQKLRTYTHASRDYNVEHYNAADGVLETHLPASVYRSHCPLPPRSD